MNTKTPEELGKEYANLMLVNGLAQVVDVEHMVALGLGVIPDDYEPVNADDKAARKFWTSYNEAQV